MANIQALGELINWVDVRNKGVISDNLLGINIDKFFMPSVANIIGTDLSSYKLIRKKQFACNPMHVGRDEKMPIALYMDDSPSIVSPAYFVFEIKDAAKVNPEYLMLWFRRAEFDRECWYHTDGSVRGGITWDEILEMTVPVPSIEEQNELVKSYSDIGRRIQIKKEINDNLEAQAQTLVAPYITNTTATLPLSEIMRFDSGFAFQSSTYITCGKYKIITIKNVQDGYIDSSDVAFINSLPQQMKNSCILQVGDVLLSLTGNVGRVGIVCEENMLLNQRVAKIVPLDNDILPFLYFVFRQTQMKMQLEAISKGTAQLNLSPIEALNITIRYERNSAVLLSQSLKAFYQQIICNNQEIRLLSVFRDSLISKLMSGE